MRTAILFVATLLLFTVGCSREVTGTARQDPNQPRAAVTEDGYGILVGDPEAAAQIEVFTEPQCPHCAALQADFGSELASYVSLGQLAVTYRPVTFLDQNGDHSARVSNAMFAAADASPRAVAFQAFVEELWAHQQPGGSGPTDAEMADMAQNSGIPAPGVAAVAGGGEAVDTRDMSDLNVELLAEINIYGIGTPTVYDLVNDEVLDINDDNWLSKLISTI
ncbi:DsbA family protein [Mycolicibacterium monacense]|uniref:Protein disulfide-isomerase n=4 Tax=Mycobacteriaceae TaxID=1762 RepID=A0AAD1J4G9_MYCMB|nr:thioredoxin domain-containing protein [Mycolicibacterium monacense]MDA4100304.1 protein-disulfide isomerase [Mycolicibacterium monacense DSM 44395]OBF48713.1 protein-disulfide isomerase [Mycolicibacterium monacense]ORB22435.1 protein-disulfide isomerase [Mycolicibacterium monacense DSM 44395]QHP84593.1 protein-disulfide isomerase [Mycolicibacterium monacense DSM 44395]BBZ62637.1 protein disulfide-isomerase [Mycolicibacterium monacense]